MHRPALIGLSLLALAGAAHAQAPAARATTPPRNGPVLALALEAAQAALSTCQANGNKVSVVVVESHGSTVVLLSGDGTSYRTAELAGLKAATTMRYKVPSGEIEERVTKEPALLAEVKADPKIGVAHRGAWPIMAGGELIGAIGVSGSPGGEKDEVCAKAGVDKIAARVVKNP